MAIVKIFTYECGEGDTEKGEFNLSKENLEKVVEFAKSVEVKNTGRFLPKDNEEFWYIEIDFYRTDYQQGKFDPSNRAHKDLYEAGNCFRTREQVKKAWDKLKAEQIIREDAEFWEPDWEDDGQRKWYGDYNFCGKELEADWVHHFKDNSVYFESKEKLKASFAKHKAEWLLHLGVE